MTQNMSSSGVSQSLAQASSHTQSNLSRGKQTFSSWLKPVMLSAETIREDARDLLDKYSQLLLESI